MKTHLHLMLAATVAALLLASCSGMRKRSAATRSVYYWSTRIDMDSAKLHFLKRYGISRMYVRYFDVVQDEQQRSVPNATLTFGSSMPKGVEIVPTVFVIPECVRADGPALAEKIVRRVMQMNATNDIAGVKELQIDCDWTLSTRRPYYHFMASMLALCHKRGLSLSATIRLHQLAQAPPPADRGVLMMYNTGDATNIGCQKPILDMRDAAPYMQHLGSYKLPLAAAYPVFGWDILFRGRQFVGILHADDDYPRLPSDTVYTRRPSAADIMQAIEAVQKRRPDANNELILFDLSNKNIDRYTPKNYETFYNL